MPDLPDAAFARSCEGLSWSERSGKVSAHIKDVENWSQQFPDVTLNELIGSGSDEEVQLRLFSPYSFYYPRRVVSSSLECYRQLETLIALPEIEPSLMEDWVLCLNEQQASLGDIGQQIQRVVVECLDAQ